MRMDPEQRSAVIMKNPQLQVFLQQYEHRRKLLIQQQQAQGVAAPSVPQPRSAVPPPRASQQPHFNMPFNERQSAKKRMKSNAKSPLEPSSQRNSIVESDLPPTPSAVPAFPHAKRLTTLNQFSKELESKGEKVPSWTLIYEDMIKRDYNFDLNEQEERVRPFDADNAERMVRDLKFYQMIRDSRLKAISMDPEMNKVTDRFWGEAYSGYGNGFTNGKVEIIMPKHRKNAELAPQLYLSPEKMANQAQAQEELVPIRLEFDQDRDGFELSDTFLWNLNEKSISLEEFVLTLMADYRFPHTHSNTKDKILEAIQSQISEFLPAIQPKQSSGNHSDLRFPIVLDITIANNQLTDRFDWDISDPSNDPEAFAEVLCADMSLPGEFVSAVSHSIREQCEIYLRSLYLIGYRFDESKVTGEELQEFLKPNLDEHNVVRPRYLIQDYTPSLQELRYDSLEKLKKERERELRRKKRGQVRVGRRGGVVLPDLNDLPKTFRTAVPSATLPGGVDLGRLADSYLEYPVSVEIPERQLKAYNEYRKDEQEKRSKLLREKVEAQAELDQARTQTHIWLQNVRMRLQAGNLHSKVSYKSAPGHFEVKLRLS